MKSVSYPGINYALNTGANVDKLTGIHFGVISQNSLMPEALDDFYTHGKDLAYDEAVEELQAVHADNPEGLELALEDLNCNWELQASNLLYESNGYKLTGCLDSDLFILRSPFFTHVQYCSPCVPGAGNLDSPCEAGPKTYCLDGSWFEDGKAPYPVYSVETGELVKPDIDTIYSGKEPA